MKALRRLLLPLVLLMGPAGCANPLHYGWAYVPLHDPHDAMFQAPTGDVEYRQLKDVEAMAEAEREMYRKGYVMVGYSNMLSPQLEAIAPGAARNWAQDVGASAVLQTFGNRHYLATFWARPRRYVFGAYYDEDLPPAARAALAKALHFKQGVIVESVVEGSPAFKADVQPGDLLIALDGAWIRSADALDTMLRSDAGSGVTIIVWSMHEGAPRPVHVALNPMIR